MGEPGNAMFAKMRRAELLARCEQQRLELAEQINNIESRLQGTDSVLGSIRSVMTKPSVVAGGLALLLTVGRSGWWSVLSRSVVLLMTARRVIRASKPRK